MARPLIFFYHFNISVFFSGAVQQLLAAQCFTRNRGILKLSPCSMEMLTNRAVTSQQLIEPIFESSFREGLHLSLGELLQCLAAWINSLQTSFKNLCSLFCRLIPDKRHQGLS